MPLYFAPGGNRTPPPNTREETVDAFAHCTRPHCAGYGQQPVKGVLTTVEHTVGSRGGDGIFANIVENTNEYLRFEDPSDIACPECGKDRDITRQQRPVYPNLSGFAPSGLLEVPAYDPNVRNTKADEQHAAQMAEMRRQMAEMAETITALKSDLGEP